MRSLIAKRTVVRFSDRDTLKLNQPFMLSERELSLAMSHEKPKSGVYMLPNL